MAVGGICGTLPAGRLKSLHKHLDFTIFHAKRGGIHPSLLGFYSKVKEDVHYAATAEDIKEYEAKYGPIPDGAFVALRTDWSKNWPDGDKMSGIAEDGSENFPGWSMDALKYIYEVRNAAANGHEALDTDASAEAEKAGDLACERFVLASGKLQIEALCNLDQVAPAGAVLIAAWPRIQAACGMPVRVYAITE